VLLDFPNYIQLDSTTRSVEGRISSRNIPRLSRLPDVVRLLLERDTDVNVLDKNNVTPLHVAENGRVGVVRVLLEHDANVGAEDKDGSTPLHAAAVGGESFDVGQNERAEAMSVLLEHGDNVGAKDKKGRTPFQIASAGGYDEMVKLLSEYGAK
jgi:ankyrin repeat protein